MGRGNERRRLPAKSPARPPQAPAQLDPWVTPDDIRGGLTLDERGNTLLVSDGSLYFVAQVALAEWFVVRFIPENAPGFDTFFFRMAEEELREAVQRDFAGWYVRRNNLGLEVRDGMVADPDP